eukprot:Opistho-1_new@84397
MSTLDPVDDACEHDAVATMISLRVPKETTIAIEAPRRPLATPNTPPSPTTTAVAPAAPAWAHLLGGGVGGTLGAIVTCPLEVVKTRLQSGRFNEKLPHHHSNRHADPMSTPSLKGWTRMQRVPPLSERTVLGMVTQIYRREGPGGLFRGLLPNIVGVAPGRAIYFASYSSAKDYFMRLNDNAESTAVHLASGVVASVSTSTITNPIWLVKTRLQLQTSALSAPDAHLGLADRVIAGFRRTSECVQGVYRNEGMRGFYKGLSASYAGIAETCIQFMLYERFKATMRQYRKDEAKGTAEVDHVFVDYLLAGGTAKLFATLATYPHEVVRTRLREVDRDGHARYRGFFRTLATVARNEGAAGLYGGLVAHLLRVVPNTGIMFLTYEFIVHHMR